MIPHEEGPGLDWTSRVLNVRTAEWAVETAETILEEAEKRIPEIPRGTVVAVPPIEISGTVQDGEIRIE